MIQKEKDKIFGDKVVTLESKNDDIRAEVSELVTMIPFKDIKKHINIKFNILNI